MQNKGTVRLADYGPEELSTAWSSLLEVTSRFFKVFPREGFRQIERNGRFPYLKEFLDAYWLRPENALNRSIEANLISRSAGFRGRILDAGCGDGLFVSLLLGGILHDSYDAFHGVDLSQRDIFNAFRSRGSKRIWKKSPRLHCRLDGIDLNANMVRRADALKVYSRLERGDVTRLPFESSCYDLVFSNILKNVKEIEQALGEMARVLKRCGRIVAVVSTNRFRHSLYYYPRIRKDHPENKSLYERLDRGRGEYNIHCYPLNQWTALFKKSGFVVEKAWGYLRTETLEFWDTGFRPFSATLLRELQKPAWNSLRVPLKKLWKKYTFEFLKPYYYNETTQIESFPSSRTSKAGYLLLVARKDGPS